MGDRGRADSKIVDFDVGISAAGRGAGEIKKPARRPAFHCLRPITWRERQEQRERQQRQQERRQRQQERQQRQQEQRQRQRERQERELPWREQQPRARELLLVCHRQSEKRPAERRAERNISLSFPLTKLINSLINWHAGREPIDPKILANNFFYARGISTGIQVFFLGHLPGPRNAIKLPGIRPDTSRKGFPRDRRAEVREEVVAGPRVCAASATALAVPPAFLHS